MDARIKDIAVYEVRCHNCDVSFAPGTKRCIHCGERIGRPRLLPGGEGEMPDFRGGDPFPEARREPPEAHGGGQEAEVEPTGGRFMRVGITIVWLLLAFITAAVRACQEG